MININVFAEEREVYFTDFDGYRQSGGEYISQTLVDMSSPYGLFSSGGTAITGAVLDDEHGTSMRFADGDWRNTNVGLPYTCSQKALVSFDFYMNSSGTFRMLANNGNNFYASFIGTSAKPEANDGTTVEEVQNVISFGTWVNVEFYIDHEADMFIFYVNGRPVGEPQALYGSKQPLSSLQFQKRAGGVMFIDNLCVKEVDEMPHTEPITLSVSAAGGAVSPEDDFVRLNFSNSVNSFAFGPDAIKVFNETTGEEITGLEFYDATSTAVSIGFGGRLEEDTDYRITVDPNMITGTFGQVLGQTEVTFYTTGGGEEITEQLLFATDFDSVTDSSGNVTQTTFENGASGYTGMRFTNWGATGPEGNPNAETGYCVGDTVDASHGTSLKMIDTFADTGETYKNVTAVAQLVTPGQNKCVVSFDFYTDQTATNPVAVTGEGFAFSLSGTRAKLADIGDNAISWQDGVSQTAKWNTAEIYIDYDEGYAAAYVNGKKLDEERGILNPASSLSAVTINTYCSTESNHSDWWFDNISVLNVKYPLHSQPITLSLSAENNTMEQGSDSVYLKFSDSVDTSYLTSSYISVQKEVSGKTESVSVSLSEATSRQVKLTFNDELDPQAVYRITVSAAVKGIAGNPLSQTDIELYPYSDSVRVNSTVFFDYFGSEYSSGNIPPELTSIECKLNKSALISDMNGAVRLLDENGAEIPSSVRYIPRRSLIKITPDTMLAGNASYTIIIDNTVLTNEYSRSFTTDSGTFAAGDILINGAANYTGFTPSGTELEITADIINTSAVSAEYTMLVGEYANGSLSSFHIRHYSILPDEYSKTETETITALSDCDTVKAFIWSSLENGAPLVKLED